MINIEEHQHRFAQDTRNIKNFFRLCRTTQQALAGFHFSVTVHWEALICLFGLNGG